MGLTVWFSKSRRRLFSVFRARRSELLMCEHILFLAAQQCCSMLQLFLLIWRFVQIIFSAERAGEFRQVGRTNRTEAANVASPPGVANVNPRLRLLSQPPSNKSLFFTQSNDLLLQSQNRVRGPFHLLLKRQEWPLDRLWQNHGQMSELNSPFKNHEYYTAQSQF